MAEVPVSTCVHGDTIVLLFGGDAMGHSPQFQFAFDPETKTYNYEPNFRYVAPYVQAADLAVVNVEVTYGGEPYSGYPNFSTPDAYHDALLGAGWDVMLLANNHILDRGRRGLERTLQVIGDVPSAGAYLDPADREARYPLILEVAGMRIALFNITYGCNGYMPIAPNMVNFIDTAQIAADLRSLEGKDIDMRIMTVHWGVEYALQAVESQHQMADWLVANGFDLVIGGHPHVVENAEWIGNVPVFYSLGNLISNQRRENTNGGILVRAKIVKGTGKVASVEYLPCFVHKGTITYEVDGKQVSERQYFMVPTTDYLAGKLPFKLAAEDEALLRRFHQLTKQRLSNMPMMK